MNEIVKGILSEKRYIHTLGVARTAEKLAERLGIDPGKAYLAGMVHDIAKEMPVTEMFDFCRSHNIKLNRVEEKNPALLHAPVGSVLIKDYGIDDTEISDAVRYHTTGRAGMSLLEKIIYLSDMIEPSRNYKEVEMLRELCEEDFHKAFAEALRQSMIWNLQKGCLIHEGTLHAWNDIQLKEEKYDF